MPTDLTPRNEKGQRHGYWEVYFDNGNLWYKGNYIHNNEDGYWVDHWANGNLAYTGGYKNGEKIGFWHFYQDDGTLIKKIFYAN